MCIICLPEKQKKGEKSIFSKLAQVSLVCANNYYLVFLADHPLISDVNLQIPFASLKTFLLY